MAFGNGRPGLHAACAAGGLALVLAACGESAPEAGGEEGAVPPAEGQQGQVMEPAEDQQSMLTGDQLDDVEDTPEQ